MAVDQEQTFLYDLDGRPRAVAHGAREAFERDNPGARRVRLFEVDGAPRAVPMDETERFRQENPGAQPVYLFDEGGRPKAVPRSALGTYVGERTAAAQRRGDERAEARRPELEARSAREREEERAQERARREEERRSRPASVAGAAASGLAEGAAEGAENLRGFARRPQAAVDRVLDSIVTAPARLAGLVADAVNPDPLRRRDVITGETGRLSLDPGEEDPYRPGPAARTAQAAREWMARREQERAPRNAAERVADRVLDPVARSAAFAAAAPFAALDSGVSSGERAQAEGATPGEALGRATTAGTTAALAFGGRLPVPGAAGVGRAVQGGVARLGQGAATAAGRGAAARTAVVAGEVARGAVDSAARMAAVTAAEGGSAGDVGLAALGGGLFGGAARGIGAVPRARAVGSYVEDLHRAGVRGFEVPPPPGSAPRGAEPGPSRPAEAPAGRGPARGEAPAPAREGAPAPRPEPQAPAAAAPRPTEAQRLAQVEADARARTMAAQQEWSDAAKRRDFKEAERLYREYAKLDEEYTAARRARIEAEEAEETSAEAPPPPSSPALPGGSAGALPAPAEPGAVPTIYGREVRVPPYYGPTISRPGDPIVPPAPYADKVPEPLPETPERVEAQRREALRALPLPQRLRREGFATYSGQFPERTAVIDAIGLGKFREIYRRHNGDFRNVTGDLVDAGELSQATGRDYSGPGGVRRALEDAAQEYEGYREWRERGAPTPEEEAQTGQEIAWNRARNAEAEAEVRRRYEMANPRMAGEPEVTPEMIREAEAAAEAGEVERIEAEAMQEQAPAPEVAQQQGREPAPAPAPVPASQGPGVPAEPQPFALDGGTPAEIDAERARVAEAQKRAAMEEAAAAPGRDLGTVSIQEGLPGLGGDGTLFTPPAGGWSGRVASGPARGDVAAETPRLAGTAAGVKPATPDGPRAAIRSELQVLLDSGEKDPATLEDLAARAEAADAFATAALARQAAGTYRGTPWGTEGGAWPAEEPPAARATVGDLVQLAKAMGDGSAPAVMRRIARHPNWAGVFRGEEGAPESGRIGIITRMARLVDDSQKARIREEAARKAAETGEDPATVYASMMVRAIRENAAAGPKPLQAVLAHEIGHFLDFLDEGTLKRGNVLGHLAALKKYMARTLFPTKAAADAAGAPGLTAAEVKAAAKEWKVPESEARRRLVEERDLLTHPEIRREMESLVAWFRQADGAPDYFRNDPAELYAEAFSAWVNYPAEAARRAPEFAAALEGWMDARPEAARALEEFRSGITQRAARAAVERGDTTDPAFFAAQEREAEAARWWQRRKAAAAANLRPQTVRQRVKAFGDALRVSLTGPLNVIRSDLMASGAGQAFRPENLPLWRAMRQAENAPNLAALWDYRFKAFVEPELEGAPYTAFLNYLKHYRIATELLGKDLDRGRMNLPNPGGVTPGDITRDGVNQATSSAAWIHALQRDQPELYAKLERARKAFWEKVRNGRDDLGGDGSPMQVVRDTPVLSKEQKEQLLGNEGYVSFSEKDLPDPSRRMGSEEQSLWDGIFSQRTGTFKEPGDVVANTIRGDYNLMRRLGQMELALRTVDWLRANRPELVGGQAETKMDPATGRLYVEQGTKPGMRTVSFLRDGRPEGWYVPVAYAEAVEMPGRGERSWDGIMGALSKVKRGLNAMQTSWNPVFNTNNSWAKDPQSLALRLPNWRVRGHGLLGGTARALGNVFGHYGEQLASYLDNSGRDYARGKYNPDTARALAWGAVNNAAPGSTAYADAQGGGVGVLEGRLRDRGLEGQTLDDAARRQILKARGLTEEQIDAGLRSAEGTLEKWAKAWDSMGTVARGARLLYPRILSQLQHGEIRTKSYALKRILAERPDLSREEAVEIARQQIGTPDMANKPAIDRSPLLGATLFQYFTPRVHGWVEQLVGAMRRGWTGGTREQATKFTRLVALTAAMSVPFLILRDAIQTYRHAEEEEGKARARGDLAAAERFAEEKEKARARARSIQAISSRDLFTKVFAFAGDGRALGFSVDPTVTPITTAVLGSLFGRDWGVKPGDALREGVGTEILPGFAPLFTAAWGNLRGFDPNTGRPIGGGEDAALLDRLSWTAETLTGRALGTGAFSYARELAAPKDDAKSEERRSRQDVPILSAAWRPFWRKTGYGLVERAAAMREEQKRVNALVGAIAERYARGQPVSEEDARWFAQHAAQPGESVRAAAERVWKLRNMTPDQRAADSLSRRSRREIEEKFGYIPPPPREPAPRPR